MEINGCRRINSVVSLLLWDHKYIILIQVPYEVLAISAETIDIILKENTYQNIYWIIQNHYHITPAFTLYVESFKLKALF